jgi:drug/metabolite transporter (DMT)-like permease
MRFLEESISDPIENTAGVICTLLFVIFLQEEISLLTWIAIGVITVGVLGVSFLENHGETTRKKKLGKTLAVVAFCMPFVYALLDAAGTFLDDAFFLIEDVANSPLVDVTEDTIEAVANTSYELTFALFALGLFIFMKAKKVKFGPIPQHKDKILAAVFETAGQFTYVYALGVADAIAAPILSSVCVVSLLLSRIFLKEKLSWKTYVFIGIVIIGILLLAVSEEL